MRRPKGCRSFVANDNEFVWFCLTCRETGIPASQRLGIDDAVLALNLDIAVSRRLLIFDRKEAENERQLLALEVGKTLFGPAEKTTTVTKGTKRPVKKK